VAADQCRMAIMYASLVGLVLVLVWTALTYNALVRARNKVEEAWSGIDVQLQRRHDLVANLVETVKAYAAHERATLAYVTRARAEAVAASGPAQTEYAEARLTAALGSVRALAESYPDLRAAESFRLLQLELAEIEDEIQAARRIYNANVQDYNTRIELFPNSLVAGPLSFRARRFVEIELPSERTVPKVAA
jgi:LemA protein